ncbi:MAG TPA: hypothetical protein ENI33_03140, partial [Thermoplasmatales archaeon]|nr:hypothetical protein [Thermoplasmatales archaeon]
MIGWTDIGENAFDYFGYSVSIAGDVNGDGYNDVIIGAYGNDDAGSYAGKAYVYYDSFSGLSSTPDWTATGENAFDYFDYSISTAGDVNGDGYDDIIIGAYGNDDAGSDTGKVYVYYGSSSGLSSTPDWTDTGENADDLFGSSVSTAGDVNGDGYDDIIVGASLNNEAGAEAGKAYMYSYPDYLRHGEFISEAFSVTGEYSVDWRGVKWNPKIQPEETNVKFQIGTSNDGINWNFYGPDGTSNTYFSALRGSSIPISLNGKYWCYKAILETNIPTHTPTIDEVIITYIKYKLPTIQLFSPNGGEDLIKGEGHVITWTAEGDLPS